MKLTIIFSALNEGDQPLKTVESIYKTADPKNFEVIIFDDMSYPLVEIPEKYKEVRVVRNKMRKGIAANLDEGVRMARTPYIFLCNARMRFKPGWIEIGIENLKKEPKTIFCSTSIVLTYEQDDINKSKTKRYGAEILYSNKDPFYGMQILEPRWMKAKDRDVYEIPCILGAAYFVTKKWYEHLKGFEGLYTYGGMCAFLSLKSWMAGGKCKLLKKLEIGNIYLDQKLYKEKLKPRFAFLAEHKFYNKLYTAFTLLSVGEGNELLYKLRAKRCYKLLVLMLMSNQKEIKRYKKYFKSIKKREINDLIIKT